MLFKFHSLRRFAITRSATYTLLSAVLLAILSPSVLSADQTGRLAPELKQQLSLTKKNTSAEALYVVTEIELDSDTHWTKKNYISIRVNDADAARDYGRIAIYFNHHYSELELEFANTISADGRVTALAKDASQVRVTGGGQDFYSDSSELVFSLPDISPGSILEFQYTRKSKILAFPGLYSTQTNPFWFQSTVARDGWRADFVHNYKTTLTAPADIPIYTKRFQGFSTPQRDTDTSHQKFTWTMKDVDGIRSELWQPNTYKIAPTLFISTMENWSKVDSWTWGNVSDKLKDTSIEQAISSLHLSKNATADEKVRAVYGYLQDNIRYVFAHLGRGGYEPHFPHEVLNVNYGDCKDQSVLAVTMLRKLGVKAYPALIETPRAGRSDPQLVSLIFDHMIVHIPESEGASTQWLDTTGDRSLFPGVSFQLANQNTLIVDGKGGKFISFPELGSSQATIKIDYFSETQNKSRAEVTFNLQGALEQNIRSWWIHSNNQQDMLQQYMTSLFPGHNSLSAEVLDSENLWQPIKIKATFTFSADNPDEVNTFGASIHQAFRMFSSINQLPLPELRQSRFLDNFDHDLNLDITVHADNRHTPVLIASTEARHTPYFDLSYKTERSPEEFSVRMSYQQPILDLSPTEYNDYYQEIQRLGKEQTWLIKLLEDKDKTRELNLSALDEAGTNPSSEHLIKKARALIESGNFSEALVPAQQAVKQQNGNGEAWYVLGMVQGFNSLIEKSSASFLKAEELGYTP